MAGVGFSVHRPKCRWTLQTVWPCASQTSAFIAVGDLEGRPGLERECEVTMQTTKPPCHLRSNIATKSYSKEPYFSNHLSFTLSAFHARLTLINTNSYWCIMHVFFFFFFFFMIYLQWSWLLETLKDQSDGSLMIYMVVKMVKKCFCNTK